MKTPLVFALLVAARASCSEPPQPPDPHATRASAGDEALDTPETRDAGTGPDGEALAAAPPRPRPREIAARHILVMYAGSERAPARVTRTQDEARSLAEQIALRARSGEDFAQLAARYSDEPGAGERGGSLGRFGHGRMVPAFEYAAFRLEVNEISNVVETPFGFHIIQRTE